MSIEDTLELSSSFFLETTVSFFPFFGLKLRVLLQNGFVSFFLPKSTSVKEVESSSEEISRLMSESGEA